MIGKAKAIPHGINDLRYIMGESKNKEHPEKINFVCSQHLLQGLDAMGVWESMQVSLDGHELKNSLLRIELSPPQEYTQDYTFKDWKDLWNDFIKEFDKQTINDKNNKVSSKPTNLAGSKYVVYLHEESKGGIPHLHGAVCRVDEDGNVNNDHDIHLRAQRAAEVVAIKRGWKTAMDVRTSNKEHIDTVCINILKSMARWSWDDYVARVEKEGYQVKARTDRLGNVKGYTIVNGKASYKASELGVGRNLTYSKLASTWRKFHPEAEVEHKERRASRWSKIGRQQTTPQQTTPPEHFEPVQLKPINSVQPKPQPRQTQPEQPDKPQAHNEHRTPGNDYTVNLPGRHVIDIDIDGMVRRLYLPAKVLDYYDDLFDYREVENWKTLTDLSCAYFSGIIPPYVPAPSGGGGSTSTSKWGKDKDDDDELERARRCGLMALHRLGRKKKSRGRH